MSAVATRVVLVMTSGGVLATSYQWPSSILSPFEMLCSWPVGSFLSTNQSKHFLMYGGQLCQRNKEIRK